MDTATPDTPDGFAIKTSALTRRFGNLTAADNVELNIPYGEIFGLLGANGAGKSTLIKMLTTLLSPTSGSAKVGGYDIIKSPGEVRRRIGYVSQLVSADGALNGYENLRLSAKLYGLPSSEREKRIANALEFMGLTESCASAGAHLFGRHDPQAGTCPGHAAPPRDPVSRRADHRA